MSIFHKFGFSLKQALLLVVFVMAASMGVGWLGYSTAQDSVLAQQSVQRQAALFEARKSLRQWADQVDADLGLTAQNPGTRAALEGFSEGWEEVAIYPGNYLQNAYIDKNPNVPNQRGVLDDAGDGSAYSRVHARFNPYFRALAEAGGYSDIYLIDADGNLLYSLAKSRDFSTNFEDASWADTGLGSVFEAALDGPAGALQAADFQPAPPSNTHFTSFVATPIVSASGEALGVLAFQIGGEFALPSQAQFAEISLIGPDGLARGVPAIKAVPISPDLAARALGAGEATLEEAGVIATFDQIELFGTPMVLLAAQPAAMKAQALARLNRQYLQTSVLAGLAISALGFLLVLGFTTPLRRARLSAARLAAHRLSLPIPGAHRKDEIGQMAGSLSSLLHDQQKASAEHTDATARRNAFQRAATPMLLLDSNRAVVEINHAMQGFLAENMAEVKELAPSFEMDEIIGHPIGFLGESFSCLTASNQAFTQIVEFGDKSIMISASEASEQADGAYILLEMRDITDTAKNTNIVSEMGCFMTIIEYAPDGSVLQGNSGFSEIFGFTSAELAGLKVEDLMPKKLRGSAAFTGIWQGLQDGKRHIGVSERCAKDGHRLWLHSSFIPLTNATGRVYRIVEIMTDITEVEEKRLIKLAEMAAIGRVQSLVHIAPDGEIIDANEKFLDLVGYQRDELIGKPHKILVPEAVARSDDYAEIWADISKGVFRTGTYKRVTKSGEEMYFHTRFIPVKDRAGNVLKILKTAVDVTQKELDIQADRKERADNLVQINHVVESLNVELQALSLGNLTAKIEAPFAPQFEELRVNFNRAVKTLRETMLTVSENSKSIQHGSTEIRQGAESLSQRTEGQAATLEETNAALQELAGAARSASDGAEQAKFAVIEAKNHAETGGDVVKDAVASMGEIEASSAQISQIISMIEDIAFQTNLLALNAGVEAARAGEAGRGFAVVAAEVRALAQRSSEAAKEINTFIAKSTEQVEQGVRLVDKVGGSLAKIVESVARSADLVSDIASIAKTQADGVGALTTSMNQLDRVTQQNAAMVEETTAAAQHMHVELEGFVKLVARFDFGEVPSVVALPDKPHALARPDSHHAPARAIILRSSVAIAEPKQDWQDF